MIKRISAGLMALLCLFQLVSCGAPAEQHDGRMKVIATNFALYDFARAVCGDDCRVEMLLAPGSEAHDYELTLSDTARITGADLLIYIGGENEDWVGDLLAVLDRADGAEEGPALHCALDDVNVLVRENAYGMQQDGEEEDEPDEHVWTSPENAIAITRGICGAVSALEPEHSGDFEERCDAYCRELDGIMAEMKELVGSADRNMIVVADRFPFRYLTEDLGLEYAAAFSGCSSNVEPTLATVNTLIGLVRERNIPVIFITELSDGKTAGAIAAETGAKIMTLYSAHNVSKEELESGITYPDLMRRNLSALREALCPAENGQEAAS